MSRVSSASVQLPPFNFHNFDCNDSAKTLPFFGPSASLSDSVWPSIASVCDRSFPTFLTKHFILTLVTSLTVIVCNFTSHRRHKCSRIAKLISRPTWAYRWPPEVGCPPPWSTRARKFNSIQLKSKVRFDKFPSLKINRLILPKIGRIFPEMVNSFVEMAEFRRPGDTASLFCRWPRSTLQGRPAKPAAFLRNLPIFCGVRVQPFSVG